MAAALSQSRALAGCKAMTMVQRTPTVKQVSNGSKYFMRKKGSFMVEVSRGSNGFLDTQHSVHGVDGILQP